MNYFVAMGNSMVAAVASLEEGQLLAVGARARLELVVEAVGLLNDAHGELLVQALVVVAERVLGLAVGGLVVAEPHADLLQLSGELLLNVLDAVDGGGLGVGSADGNDLPVQLAIV